MKSEFLLAFNEICQERGLPQETVIEALKTALVSAYRRNVNVSNLQEVTVDIDPRTGEPTIYAEKEVVDDIIDDRTEVALTKARQFYPEAELGEMVMMDSTPRNFGRIAAQTAKQVILQRVREAERDKLYDDFASREGEIVNGTVQSISGQNITIGLGRTEAILPKSQQVPTERYRPHDKIRVYVLEVRRTNRGPQIYVSRNHRNLLRRLLELEVPEIYNGQVDIKSIAREAGQRSKVAVMALQPGVDPVGACVGMRGVRIQSIVRELSDEKIDVIEWDNNQTNFIAKALSPARVSAVFLEEDPDTGKTAVVIVPDDQLSLAIGREGQNARLAAKLTGWRIDIKSLTEAGRDSLDQLDHTAVDKAIREDQTLINHAQNVVEKKEAGRPITAEDYLVLTRLVNAVEGKIIAARSVEHDAVRKARASARKRIPDVAWKTDLEELNLKYSVHTLLLDNEIKTVGDVLYHLELGDMSLLAIDGFGDKALEQVKKAAAGYQQLLKENPDEALALASLTVADIPADVLAVEVAEADTAVSVMADEADDVVTEAEDVFGAPDTAVAETVPAAEEDEDDEEIIEAEDVFAAPEVPVQKATPAKKPQETVEKAIPEASIDDLGSSLIDLPEPEPEKKETKKKKVVVVRAPGQPDETEDEDEAERERRRSRKGKELVYDEDAGRVVVKRKRKGSRRRPDWEDFGDEDFL
ncbi:MAG: transcription termination/antitermination protein NusA [Anaerolineales bacterium]|nr:transcription termination/antitermination protein NusA [Anaerolineales bacterium]